MRFVSPGEQRRALGLPLQPAVKKANGYRCSPFFLLGTDDCKASIRVDFEDHAIMKNDSPAMLSAITRARGLLRSSEPSLLCPAASRAVSLLEEAAELLVLDRDFATAVDRCEKGCQSLLENDGDSDGSSSEDLKCSLCIVGIQALAEMDRWREVLPWILQYYHKPEGWPPKILELCILLHSKVEEPHVMLDVGGDWLYCPSNQNLSSYGLLAQLYLIHVLSPLGRFLEAEKLIQGSKALSPEQREDMHKTLQENKHQWREKEEASPIPEEHPKMSWKLQLASPTSLPFLYRLTQLFNQARLALFPPSRRPPVQD
ncbi:peroxisome assembly protein 26 isoform X1 [Erythrolamprus reginae]|uniref:peroxisome assembly protein 26 isoform X1 n=1 Tax=Erythrolamprus reginae TaxID=121349 RepID=UPI00396CC7BB